MPQDLLGVPYRGAWVFRRDCIEYASHEASYCWVIPHAVGVNWLEVK